LNRSEIFLGECVTGEEAVKNKTNAQARSIVFKTGIPGLDDLLKDGGIIIPKDNKDGVSILITGQAGAGKSTLALLLAVQAARQGGGCVYVALEQSSYSLRHLARSFRIQEDGWKWLDESVNASPQRNEGFLYVVSPQIESQEPSFDDYLEPIKQAQKYLMTDQYSKEGNQSTDDESHAPSHAKDILVVDSLNVFGGIRGVERLQFEQLKRELSAKDRILIFIGDPTDQKSQIWSLLVDMVIELGNRTPLEYLLRTIRVAKARFQNHILGHHVMKIKGISSEKDEKSATEYGFIVYPSLHYHLSVAIERREELQEESKMHQEEMSSSLLETGFEELDRALGGGIKRSTMTALSSDLPYSNAARGIGIAFLMKGHENNERGLYISLQDDPQSIVDLYPRGGALPPLDKRVLEESIRIEPFRPGFISAEEFVDKIIKIIWDEKRGDVAYKRVVFDDVSQIGLRFPLLAHAPVFLPTLMDIFKLYNMTVLFFNAYSDSEFQSPTSQTSNLNNLVSTVIEIKAKAPTRRDEGHIRIHKIASRYRVPKALPVLVEQEKDGFFQIKSESL
jgi:KaiC/GvpD/RAD55 family RecA-like ATPase